MIMPNHVHVLLLPKTSLPVITRWLQGSTARQANLILGRTGEAFWQDESFDHRVRDEAELDRLVRYVEYNPVSAGLATNPRAWHWSSARWLAGESAWRKRLAKAPAPQLAQTLGKCRNSRDRPPGLSQPPFRRPFRAKREPFARNGGVRWDRRSSFVVCQAAVL